MAVIKSISLPFFLLIALIFIHTDAATISVQNNCNYTVWAYIPSLNMTSIKSLSLVYFFLISLLFTLTQAATINVRNNCPYTVWAAGVPGGGKRLDPGQSWDINALTNTTGARVWGRTGCTFDESGWGRCHTGDCNGLLQCQGYGSPPNTVAEYALNYNFNKVDYFDISLVDGFNVPMEFSPNSSGCTRGIKCTGDINGQCPNELQAPGGCNNPCTAFKTAQYCCNSGNCGPTNYSKFFKDRCPDAYSYPKDDETSTFTCPAGTNYEVVFCPSTYYVLLCN